MIRDRVCGKGKSRDIGGVSGCGKGCSGVGDRVG